MRSRWLPLSFACALLLPAFPARAQICPDDPAAVAPIAPVSYNPKYLTYKTSPSFPISLVGMSHEYLCHIPQPQRVGQYCALGSYPAILANLQDTGNSLIRLWTVFNHSPGREAYGAPFTNEQPFKYVNGKWDLNVVDNANIGLTNLNTTYYTNLEAVVHEAFCRNIIVEVALLDPWCGTWATSPFNPVNTTDGKGFTSQRIFMSFMDLVNKTDSGQNLVARNAQKLAMAWVVRKLKRFPNVIFEVANEPDLIPSGMGITPTHTTDLQKMIVTGVIQPNDNPAPSNHLIMVNGHQSGAFAWSVPGAKVESAHYTNISDTRYGAVELLRAASLKAARANYAVSFNENKAIGGTGADPLTADDVRSEAWEFAFNEGALFDGYSVDRSNGNTTTAVIQLGLLRRFLAAPGAICVSCGNNIWYLADMQQTSCNQTGNWCRNVPAYGTENAVCSPPPQVPARTYWATFKGADQYALYLHHGVLVNSPGSPSNPFQRYDARVCSSAPADPKYTLQTFQYQVLQNGCWKISWVNPKDMAILSQSTATRTTGIWYSSSPPPFTHDVAALVGLLLPGGC